MKTLTKPTLEAARALIARIDRDLGYPKGPDHQSACALVHDTDTGEWAVVIEDHHEALAFTAQEKTHAKPFDSNKWNGSRNR